MTYIETSVSNGYIFMTGYPNFDDDSARDGIPFEVLPFTESSARHLLVLNFPFFHHTISSSELIIGYTMLQHGKDDYQTTMNQLAG